jgi:hypothetical protein
MRRLRILHEHKTRLRLHHLIGVAFHTEDITTLQEAVRTHFLVFVPTPSNYTTPRPDLRHLRFTTYTVPKRLTTQTLSFLPFSKSLYEAKALYPVFSELSICYRYP